MKKYYFFILCFVIIYFPFVAHASVDFWQQGMSLRLQSQPREYIIASLQELVQVGADYLTITPGWITDSVTSSNVDRKPTTPSDDLLEFTIQQAHALGMKVMLKPHLDIKGGRWRANLDPADKKAFFDSYSRMIMLYAQMAKRLGVEQFSLGAELYKLTTNKANESYWRNLIFFIRQSGYQGKLTYSAIFGGGREELDLLPFWDVLDYIGLSLYPELSTSNSPTVTSLKDSWEKLERTFVYPAFLKFGKPVIVTETGFASADGAAQHPESSQGAKVDLQEQVDLYRAFFDFWDAKDYMIGVHLWDWWPLPNTGGSSNNDFTPQNKPALDVLRYYFLRNDAPLGNGSPVTPPVTDPTSTIPIFNPPISTSTQPEPPVATSTDSLPLPPTGVTRVINVETPENAAKISGEKKMKVYVRDLPLDQYSVTYSVGGGSGAVVMNNAGGKYKQAKVNFDEWNWNADGPYVVTFTAFDLFQNIIAQETIVVFVKH